MKYHAPTNQFTISAQEMQRASYSLLWAIKGIREGAGLCLTGYKNEGPMKSPQFAEQGVLDAARDIGIDLGGDRYGKLDVSEAG